MPELSFQYRPATSSEIELTTQSLLDHSRQALNTDVGYQPFGIFAYAGEKLMGAVIGKIFFNWMHIDIIWVAPEHRKGGLGTKLMKLLEERGKENLCDGIEVWTQSWQAPGFYHNLGYEEFAVLEDFAPGRKRHVFRRYLKDSARPAVKMAGTQPLPEIVREHVKSYFRLHGDTLPSSGIYSRLMPLFEKPLLEVTLEITGGNQIKAANLLGINRNTLRKKITELGIKI
jgi:DNA-binding protein Fis